MGVGHDAHKRLWASVCCRATLEPFLPRKNTLLDLPFRKVLGRLLVGRQCAEPGRAQQLGSGQACLGSYRAGLRRIVYSALRTKCPKSIAQRCPSVHQLGRHRVYQGTSTKVHGVCTSCRVRQRIKRPEKKAVKKSKRRMRRCIASQWHNYATRIIPYRYSTDPWPQPAPTY